MEAKNFHPQHPITFSLRRPTIRRLMRNLPLQQLNIKQILLRNPSSTPNPTAASVTTAFFHHHQRLKILATMTDNEPKQPSELIDLKKKEAEEKLPPPPPEKPLPGDCCGNGCTPCVWDQYYEELEEYNKILLQHKNMNDSQSKS